MVLGEIASPLEAELWGSDILAALGGAASLAAQAMVPAAERSGSPEALAILRVLGALGWPDLRDAGERGRGRLAGRGVPDPGWAAEVGSPSVGECWRYGDDRGVQEAVTLSFEYTAGRHVVSLLLDHSCGGAIKNVWVGEAGDVLARTKGMAAEDPSMIFEMISPARRPDQGGAGHRRRGVPGSAGRVQQRRLDQGDPARPRGPAGPDVAQRPPPRPIRAIALAWSGLPHPDCAFPGACPHRQHHESMDDHGQLDSSRVTCVLAGVLSVYGARPAGNVGGRGQCDSQASPLTDRPARYRSAVRFESTALDLVSRSVHTALIREQCSPSPFQTEEQS